MACGRCGKGNRHIGPANPELKKFAYLTPRQLRLLNGEPSPAPETPPPETPEEK